MVDNLNMDSRNRVDQYNQASVILELSGKNQGIFIEVGAYDGFTLSNTYELEKMHGWTGVLVEPIKAHYESCVQNRWSEIFNGVVYDRDGDVDFKHIQGYSEMLSGIEEAYHPSCLSRIGNEMRQHNQKAEIVKLPCLTINGLMEKYHLRQADYLSLDVQSAELQVLKAYDPTKNPIKCVSLDTNRINTDEIHAWFVDHGYKLHWKHKVADEYMFINDSMKFSWE